MPRVNLTIPVFNEEAQLTASIEKLLHCLEESVAWEWEVVIADNGSSDRTAQVAWQVSQSDSRIRLVHLGRRGRGRALKQVWLESQATVLSYMDVDLSTDLAALPALIEAVGEGGCDLAVGSRLLPGSRVQRGWRREFISRVYNRLVKQVLGTHFSDAQCGFKAIKREAAQALLPLVEDTGWFFDTELLLLAEKLGYRLCELPVRWVEDPDSRVKLIPTVWGDLKGLMRLYRKWSKRGLAAPGGAGNRVTKRSQRSTIAK